jgi:hypothetical protein
MSIIDQASAESSRRYNADLTDPEASRWRRDTRAAFMDGAQWLLVQLADPDQATVDAVARQLNHEGWTCLEGGHEPDFFDSCDDCKAVCRPIARASITALVTHLNGADHE